MPRKGFEKVRTGCITCKTRKVKCDESWPGCLRCEKSGRICGGYRKPPPASFSWKTLLQVRPSTIPSLAASSSSELRGLDFFRCIVAPALTSPLGNSFWTRPVCQLAIQEPATRYAVLAISSLYERFDPFSYDFSLSNEQPMAVSYYNKAMMQVATSKHLDADTALLISILFTCVEFLRGNTHAALEHVRHGTQILRSARTSSDSSAILNHLSIFPFFFGATLSDFPLLQPPKYSGHKIHNLSHAAETLDYLMSRCVRLLRAFDPFRLGAVEAEEMPRSLIMLQSELRRELDLWCTEFSMFKGDLNSNTENEVLLRILEMRWHVCTIWLNIAPHQDEMICDTFKDQFKRIIEIAREDATSRNLAGTESPNLFKFEMGLSPLLHFVALKCRFLELRLEAWTLLRIVACARESLWDARLMYAIGKTIIEREHGIELPPWLAQGQLEHISLDYTLPNDNQRIRDSYLEDETEVHLDFTRRRISLFVPHNDQKELGKVRDWIYLPEKSEGWI